MNNTFAMASLPFAVILSLLLQSCGMGFGPSSLSGTVTTAEGTGLGGVTLVLTGPTSGTTVTDAQGQYYFADLNNKSTYTVVPSAKGYVFTPSSRTIEVGQQQTVNAVDFVAGKIHGTTVKPEQENAAGISMTADFSGADSVDSSTYEYSTFAAVSSGMGFSPNAEQPLSGFGTPLIDGVMGPGEWNAAAKISFNANLPQDEGGGTTPATVYVMNDDAHIYFAVMIERPSLGGAVSATFEFDNDGDCLREDGDDVFGVSVGEYMPAEFHDAFRYTCPGADPGTAGCAPPDTALLSGFPLPGTKDGAGAATNNGVYTIIEMSHPLNSGDSVHDFSLSAGDSVNFFTSLRLFSLDTSCNEGSDCYADTDYPGFGIFCSNLVGSIKIAAPSGTSPVSSAGTAVIDIKPGYFPNSINPSSEGKIPVAILSTADFNAPVGINQSSLTFGHTGDEQSLAFCNESGEDVNGDNLPDLVCHFFTQGAGFMPGDREGILKSLTTGGLSIVGKDSVRIVPVYSE